MSEPEPARSSAFHLATHARGAAWKALVDLISAAAADGREEFAPGRELPTDLWRQITTLPAEIATLQRVKHFVLYGSNLVALPPEIGAMTALEVFEPYTSHRLHWFPYEITRCPALRESTVSTRVLYGNFKTRASFPSLPAQLPEGSTPSTCSVCKTVFTCPPMQRWISLRIATDVLPLLVHACSQRCIDALPASAPDHAAGPHQGGSELPQPPSSW